MVSYSEYYQRAIDGNDLGIKLVLGPTGLGKSSSIPEVVNPMCKFFKRPTDPIEAEEPDRAH